MIDEPNTETAFPAMLPGGNYCTPGMTLRDWFAGQTVSGMLACGERSGSYRDYADDAYKFADAILAARDRDTTTVQQIALGIGGSR